MTSSRELVRKTLEFRSPERIPRQMWLLPWASDRYPQEVAEIQRSFPDDIVNSPSFFRDPPQTSGDEYAPGTYVDEWGCVFVNTQKGIIGEVKEPLLKDWGDLDKVRPPRGRLSVDRCAVNAFVNGTERFVLAPTRVRPFEQLQFIRGPERLFLDLAHPPRELHLLLDRIHSFYREELELWAGTRVDALLFCDDWGGQHSLLVSPALWRQMFKPLYKEYAEIAHRHGKYLFMHTDGYVADIIPDLIELGVDALNAQLFCMDIEDLGRRFRGRITFWGEIDRQYLLPYGTREEVARAVGRLKDALWANGGLIAQCEFGIGALPANVRCVFETWGRAKLYY